jgi:hypothetical protein
MGDNTMKKLAGVVALFALAVAEVAWASAVATAVTGTVTAQAGAGTPRTVRVGDRLNQADTIVTGPASAAVIKFEDGQVAALTANSRMTITSYSYDRASQRGNSLLSLVSGAMSYISGVMAKVNPRSAGLRAATATIGIRGTEVKLVTMAGVIYAEVNSGTIEFTFNNQTVTVNVGNAALVLPNGTLNQGTIQQILTQLQQTPVGQQIIAALQGLAGLTALINQAAPGIPIQGEGGTEGGVGTGTGAASGTATGSTGIGGGGGGGGTASPN